MRLLAGTDLRVALDRMVFLPGEEVGVRVSVGDDVDRVGAARVELGFVNPFRYRWAGHRDAAAVDVTEAITWLDPTSPGTTHGTDKEAEEWISVLGEELPARQGRLAGGEHRLSFRLPSWSPPSSRELARWAVRASVSRARARDASAEAELTVLAPHPAGRELERLRLQGGATEVDIRLADEAVRAGKALHGTIALTPSKEVRPVTVTLSLLRARLSHPVARRPGDAVSKDVTRLRLAQKQPLQPRITTELPFSLETPADAAPTGEAPNSSVQWWVEAWAMYAGFAPPDVTEKVRRELVIYNAGA